MENKKNNILQVVDADLCSGCSSCYSICPHIAIIMKDDSEGFTTPHIDGEKCTNCGLCLKSCPVTKDFLRKRNNNTCYAVMGDDELRMKSSSGGMFTLLAEKTLKKGGVVFGATYNDDYTAVKHVMVNSVDGLEKLRKSKYLQSDMGDCFKQAKYALLANVSVLFSGCPCQIAGLYSFLGKDYPNLLTVDIVCHGVPSPLAYRSFLSETAKGREIKSVDFRAKEIYGWSTPIDIRFTDGSYYIEKWDESPWYNAFLKGIATRKCCSSCKYATIERVGDITLGDFWQVHRYKKEYNDWKGTSLVLINSDKGKQAFSNVKPRMKLCEPAPLDFATQYNGQLVRPCNKAPGRKYFFKHLVKDGFEKAFWYGQEYRYDVGLVGWWFASNYGSALTYFALGNILKDMDRLPIMIRVPKTDNTDWEPQTATTINFIEKHFLTTKHRDLVNLHEVNRFCDSFALGSDQLWVDDYIDLVGYTFFLDFADDDHKRFAIATSFGHAQFETTDERRKKIIGLLNKFEKISVREETGIAACKNNFDIEADRILDPVFICDIKHYNRIAEQAQNKPTDNYLLCYILDPTEEIQKAIETFARKKGLRIVTILNMKTHATSKEQWFISEPEDVVSIEQFVYYFKNCSYLITDSHHGICFGILYHKDFIAIANESRGLTRFTCLLDLFDLRNRLIFKAKDMSKNKKLEPSIDYAAVDTIMKAEKERSIKWIEEFFEDKP